MNKKNIYLSLFLFLPWMMSLFGATETAPKRWVVYYANKANFKDFLSYSLVVFANKDHPFLEGFQERGITTLGYLSLGEMEKGQPYFEDIQKEGLVLEENPNWKGSFFVDMRDPRWAKHVIEDLIPLILYQRFDGLFLDTLDDAEYLENIHPRFKGMKEAAVRLVKAIRLHYPHIKLMVNRGYTILPEIAKTIDMETGESVYTTYNQKTKVYEKVPQADYESQVSLLQKAKEINPKLELYTIDYWNPKDPLEISKIYKVERDNGFIPYVSTILLDEIVPEPK